MTKVLLFPGQGSQAIGMGQALWSLFPAQLAQANDLLGYDIQALCMEDPHACLDQTEFTQTAIFVVNHLSYLQWQRSGGQSDIHLGHSIGQYNALVAAKVMSFAEGLQLVKIRAQLMAQQRGGAMAAIMKIPSSKVLEKLDEFEGGKLIDIANYNSEEQTIIAGPAANIDAVSSQFMQEGAIAVRLNTSGAFHSRYLELQKIEFSTYLDQVRFRHPEQVVICNVTGQPVQNQSKYLADHLTHPVLWQQSIYYILRRYQELEWIELGNGKTLSGILRYNRQEFSTRKVPMSS